ncbi:hypothetical protein HYH02_002728 [Chlamydomonas schloesseri]|uniref:Biotin-protein ligase N-terminal domain-containing protein n=1 Tax=Chlamydomonas schloesseri TaxID=2026947 RepID=A0A835WR03_9CHLO|nr:hypothetical protein HYH02_002728 [Chlamydomonas schloesseri]|eukprot:KAG2452489.1 hypothetical protein HYH02_002728 [Chlamydomonas schloesseri]
MEQLRRHTTGAATARHGNACASAEAPSTSRCRGTCRASAVDASASTSDAAQASSSPAVMVYNGEGAGYRSARTALESAREFLAPGVHVRFLSTSELLEGSWVDRCLLLIMPGGADLPYCKHLNGRGNRIIRGYVEAGGAYLGICAGAYYACSRVEFEPGSRLQVVGDRELAFFPGRARGAAYPGFDYLSEAGSTAAPLAFRPPPPQLLAAAALEGSPRDPRHGAQPQPQPQPQQHQQEAQGGVGGGERPPAAGLAPRHLRLRHKPSVPAAAAAATAPAQPSGPVAAAADSVAAAAAPGLAAAPGQQSGQQWHYCRDYSNGGPVFELLASAEAAGPASGSAAGLPEAGARAGAGAGMGHEVEVLAVYPELGDALAAVRCRVGSGVAVLCGTHPELPAAALGEAVEALGLAAHDPAQAVHIARLGSELGRWEEARRSFWLALLLACCSSVPWTGPRAAEFGRAAAGGDKLWKEEEEMAAVVVSGVHGSQEVRLMGAADRSGQRNMA